MGTNYPEGSGQAAGSELVGLGRWSALVCGLGAVAYGVAGTLVGMLAASAITWENLEQFVSGYRPLPTVLVLLPPFVVAVVFPVLVVAVYSTVREERKPLGLAALVFAGIYTSVLGADYWLQITNVPWNILRDSTAGLAPWVVWNPASLFWSFEGFGYFALGVSCFFLALAHDRGVLPRRLRGGLLGLGALGVLFLINNLKDLVVEAVREGGYQDMEGVATGSALSLVFAWVILFGFVSFSFARWFASLQATGSSLPPHDVIEAPNREVVSWPAK